ncbi:ABC transporter substrate-binding protein [Paenibacillus mendelii]|uniref:ABC transporter substrate-binding protein n=1 Tax=Paenibacillus mendelii TaxID=206163 RepID=A0ABV6J9M9_9BACL|nr:extracellular solute-binding protein [Paenibacillus mendelii]MCQ6559528.1 extracellular solute-binding protein [Paenibacillus mendelii]
MRKIRGYSGALLAVTALFFMGLLSGCMGDDEGEQGEKSLKIAISSKDYYEFAYKDYIEAAFPELKVELIELEPDYQVQVSDDDYIEAIEKEKPDLILTSSYRYELLTERGILTDLSVRMADSGMKEDDFYPGMIEWMKRSGDGKLYGLAPDFQSSALYYNADLFEKYGIDPPQDGMTLAEVYQLGSRFVEQSGGKEGVVGFYQQYINQPYDMLDSFGSNEGLRMVDFAKGRITMDTPLWRDTLQTMINLYKNGTLTLNRTKGEVIDGVVTYGKEAVEAGDLFGKGKAAMTVVYYNDGVRYKFKAGAVTPPVSSSDRSRTNSIYVFEAMGIPAGSANAAAAWDVIRFMTSDHMAKVRAGLNSGEGFSVRRTYTEYMQDPLIGKLFELMPVQSPRNSRGNVDIQKFNPLFNELVNREVEAAILGEKSTDEVIRTIHKEGQALLDAATLKN